MNIDILLPNKPQKIDTESISFLHVFYSQNKLEAETKKLSFETELILINNGQSSSMKNIGKIQ